MAYCVHCGVKLNDGEPRCPLCGTQPPLPHQTDPAPERSFPVRAPEQTLKLSRRYAITLLSLLLLVPAAGCVLFDFIGGNGILWSIYPAGMLVLIWIAVTVPLLFRRHRLYSSILITGGTLAAYLYMVGLLNGDTGWFFPIVLPSLLLAIALTCLTVWIVRGKRLRILRLVALLCVEISVLCLLIELLCVRAGLGTQLSWSPYVFAPCLFFALLLYLISRNGPLSAELKRRFHF